MPHATGAMDKQDAQDDLLIQQVLDPQTTFDVNRELEPGEKADDAVDYGDLSDDSLAEEEGDEHDNNVTVSQQRDPLYESLEGFGEEEGQPVEEENGAFADDIDDLFADTPQSPIETIDAALDDFGNTFVPQLESFRAGPTVAQDGYHRTPLGQSFAVGHKAGTSQPASLQGLNTQTVPKDEQMQQYLISMSSQGATAYATKAQDLATLWPKFERDSVPRFMDLLPLKRSHYANKEPPKQPKPVCPTKLNLDVAQDQEKQFRLSYAPRRKTDTEDDQHGIVKIPLLQPTHEGEGKEEGFLSESEDEAVGGVTWQDLQIVCEDWDHQSLTPSSEADCHHSLNGIPHHDDHEDHFVATDDVWDVPPAKRRKTSTNFRTLLHSSEISIPAMRDPAYTTSKIAQAMTIDLNDPRILVEPITTESGLRETAKNSNLKTAIPLIQRYNISNDEAYDLLKENHQSKIRSNLGNPQIEHSLPAVRLQWPYYKTKLEKQEARSFHRPVMSFHKNEKILFNKPRHIKRKHLKGKDTLGIYERTHDLSLGDNSSVLLLEYSEEFPTIMSNFGMGSRIINYYRRRNVEDSTRPRLEIGETNLLMPQDKSPFSTFGHIDPGETSPALYNGMYKAPLFTQEAKNNDFVVVRNTTGVNGPSWYIRNIEHLRVVGQEFPSVDVPGPHSRKVTTAAKNRLKMISYRLLRKSRTHKIKVAAVTKHFTDSTDMQNRQKMKEFMRFDKNGKEWEMRSGEAIPDEESIRSMVKPEDVCLLESMQVGQQHLQDAGFGQGDDDAEGDAANQGRGIEQLLAPWFTTRNFLNAVQGKAMLELHGEGDPSGRGEAFSFIKTSMKGGFKAMGESVEDRLDAKKMKELGGHSYNVARQQRSYEESIRRIWDAQKHSLSSTQEHSDVEKDDLDMDDDDAFQAEVQTPRSQAETPACARRRDDETMSQVTKNSSTSQAGKILRITRKYRHPGGSVSEKQEIVRDPRVIQQYRKRRNEHEFSSIKLQDVRPTGDAEKDRAMQQILDDELARLERNKDRRLARDKQKGLRDVDAADSPGLPSSAVVPPAKGVGTSRKCANCGQQGHIKTNKKCCSSKSPFVPLH
ncbi:MAG: hypothetical protein LQ346_002436 [Caloplaca aetnensis]|nr:MAG: hypothetical protein LQ346_002436 [Caloplaca aetnensis]